MAGNVSEWTATLTHKSSIDYPIICGGNFGNPEVEVTRRVSSVASIEGKDRVGFRTVSDTPPADAKK